LPHAEKIPEIFHTPHPFDVPVTMTVLNFMNNSYGRLWKLFNDNKSL